MSGHVEKAVGFGLVALPTVSFVATNLLCGLEASVIVAAGVAAAVFVVQTARRASLRATSAGLLIALSCAAVAAATGEARGFFLVPAMIPIAVVIACAATIVMGRPLTGLVLNRIADGPADWAKNDALRQIYTASTGVIAVVSIFNAALQTMFYMANQPIVLGVIHIATAPVFACIVAATILCVRRSRAGRRQLS